MKTEFTFKDLIVSRGTAWSTPIGKVQIEMFSNDWLKLDVEGVEQPILLSSLKGLNKFINDVKQFNECFRGIYDNE